MVSRKHHPIYSSLEVQSCTQKRVVFLLELRNLVSEVQVKKKTQSVYLCMSFLHLEKKWHQKRARFPRASRRLIQLWNILTHKCQYSKRFFQIIQTAWHGCNSPIFYLKLTIPSGYLTSRTGESPSLRTGNHQTSLTSSISMDHFP